MSSNCGVFLRWDETSPFFLPSFLPFFLPSVGAWFARRRSALIISLCALGYSKWFIYRQQRRHCLIGTSRNLVRRPPAGSNKFWYPRKPTVVSICIYQLRNSCIERSYPSREIMDNAKDVISPAKFARVQWSATKFASIIKCGAYDITKVILILH